jgi:hypothetical protein
MGKMKAIAVLLIVVLAYQPLTAAAKTTEQNKGVIKERLAKIPVGKNIVVKLQREHGSKIKGKLLSVTDESFEIQTVQSGKVSHEKIVFAEVESVKTRMRGLYKALIIVGAVALALGIAVAASGRSSGS